MPSLWVRTPRQLIKVFCCKAFRLCVDGDRSAALRRWAISAAPVGTCAVSAAVECLGDGLRRAARPAQDGSDSERLLRALLGLIPHHPGWSLTNRPTQLRGTVVIAQPGLSWTQLGAKVERNDLSAIQIRDLLAVFDDSLGALAESRLVCSS
jgi:hypothetical protein